MQKFYTLTRPEGERDADFTSQNKGFVFGLKSLYHNIKHVHNPFYRNDATLVNGTYVVNHETNESGHVTDHNNQHQYPGIVVNNMTYDCSNNHVTNMQTNGDYHKQSNNIDSEENVCPMVRVVSVNGHVTTSDVTSVQSGNLVGKSPPSYEECI